MADNIVISALKWAVSLMKNQMIAALAMLVQGIMFIVMPGDDMTSLVIVGAIIVILAAAVNIFIFIYSKNKGFFAVLLAILNTIILAAAIVVLIFPQLIEQYVRYVVGMVTVIGAVINIAETFRLENKHSWKFIVGLAAGIFLSGLGIVLIVADTEKVIAMQQGIGWVLILNALINVWYILRMYITIRREK